MFELGLSEQLELLALARRTLEFFCGAGHVLDYRPRYPALEIPAGVFVSLRRQETLRGCVGRVCSDSPLHQSVRELALAAAFEDPRFPPVEGEELCKLAIEISVLSPGTSVTDPAEIQIGTHGLLITQGPHHGVLLPQVAAQCGWDSVRFLEETCVKAGLPRQSWRHGAAVEKFSAQVFAEGRLVLNTSVL